METTIMMFKFDVQIPHDKRNFNAILRSKVKDQVQTQDVS